MDAQGKLRTHRTQVSLFLIRHIPSIHGSDTLMPQGHTGAQRQTGASEQLVLLSGVGYANSIKGLAGHEGY